ncbi:MAG: carboxypeptidase-like regulatory domain-containing protein [Acidobacteriaceae bacterium]
MRRVVPGLLLMMMVAGTGQIFALQTAAVISGTVRDVHGTPQMGALIELSRAGDETISTAVSDMHGRYIMTMLSPGRYQLRATAAFFLPVLKNDVRLHAGMQAVVNVTLNNLFDADNWLPAQRRRADEPVDDWKWTLRSTASRPLLRLVDPEDGSPISSSADQPHRVSSQGRIILTNGNGAFGDGGLHQSLLLDRTMEDGDGAVLRADVGDVQANASSPQPSVAVIAGYERRAILGGSTRLVSSFQSHPELTDGGSTGGFQVLRLASTQQFPLGNAFLIDVGTLMEAERLEQTRLEAEPFVRLTARPGSDFVVEYRYASSRDLQSSDDLDELKPVVSVVPGANGRPLSDRGMHQELSASRKVGSRVFSASAYVDRISYGAIGGSGLISNSSLQLANAVADPTTGTFEVGGPGYAARGLSVSMVQTLTPALSAWVEYDLGTALRTNGALVMTDLADGLTPQTAAAASVALRGRIARSGTALRVEYRWQPVNTLTQVNAYNVMPEEAYMTFYIRQRLWSGSMLPQGLDAVVEATNLLEQGYQPVLAPDGQTLVLAQVPRAIMGGLAFNF